MHHISNKMVADKDAFKDSAGYKKIKKLFENENTVVVATATMPKKRKTKTSPQP